MHRLDPKGQSKECVLHDKMIGVLSADVSSYRMEAEIVGQMLGILRRNFYLCRHSLTC